MIEATPGECWTAQEIEKELYKRCMYEGRDFYSLTYLEVWE
jgi:hypothetical protein